MITAFGKELRKIRIEHGETMKDMATALGVSVSFLSSVEVGRKNVPGSWIDTIAQHYGLDIPSKERLVRLAQDSVTSIKIDLYSSEQKQRSAALIFARNFDNVSADTAQKIIDLLSLDK